MAVTAQNYLFTVILVLMNVPTPNYSMSQYVFYVNKLIGNSTEILQLYVSTIFFQPFKYSDEIKRISLYIKWCLLVILRILFRFVLNHNNLYGVCDWNFSFYFKIKCVEFKYSQHVIPYYFHFINKKNKSIYYLCHKKCIGFSRNSVKINLCFSNYQKKLLTTSEQEEF